MGLEPVSKTIERLQDDRAKATNKGFTMLYNTILQSDNYNVYEKVILMVLKSFCFKSNECWPSINMIAKMIGCCRNTVMKTLMLLETKGLIQKIKGEHSSTTYKVKAGPFQSLPKSKW